MACVLIGAFFVCFNLMPLLCKGFKLFKIVYIVFSLFSIQAFSASRCGFSSRTCGTGLVHPGRSYLHDGAFPASLAPGCYAIPLSESALPSPLLSVPCSCLLHSQAVAPTVYKALRAKQQQAEPLFWALWVMQALQGFSPDRQVFLSVWVEVLGHVCV